MTQGVGRAIGVKSGKNKNAKRNAKVTNPNENRRRNAEELQTIKPTCFDLEKTDRYVAPMNNDIWTTNVSKMKLECRCKENYYNLSTADYIYYSKCPHNVMAGLRIR